MAASSSGSSGTGTNEANDALLVPLVHDDMSFDGRQLVQKKEIERKIDREKEKKKRDWDDKVEIMRREILELYPCDKAWGSEEMLNDPLVRKRRGSTDVLDRRRMRTLFMEYPDSGRRFKLRFNVINFEPKNVNVSCDTDRIVVRGTRKEEAEGGEEVDVDYVRKIEKPKEVDPAKLKSFLTCDGVLIVDSPCHPHSLNLRKLSQSPSHSSQCSHASSRSRSPSNSPNTPHKISEMSPRTPQKMGVPVFHERDNNKRRFSLILDIGTAFAPKEVTVQIIKDNRIQVKAKHEERTSEKFSKHKYNREFELSDRIEPYTLRAGLSVKGHLMVGAWAKGHVEGLTRREAGDLIACELGIGNKKDDVHKVCNVLDLASFPPTNVAVGTLTSFPSEKELQNAGSTSSVASS